MSEDEAKGLEKIIERLRSRNLRLQDKHTADQAEIASLRRIVSALREENAKVKRELVEATQGKLDIEEA